MDADEKGEVWGHSSTEVSEALGFNCARSALSAFVPAAPDQHLHKHQGFGLVSQDAYRSPAEGRFSNSHHWS